MGKINLGRVVGNKIYTGTEFPQEIILDGDIFINKANFEIYQYKNNVWELVLVDNVGQALGDIKTILDTLNGEVA